MQPVRANITHVDNVIDCIFSYMSLEKMFKFNTFNVKDLKLTHLSKSKENN